MRLSAGTYTCLEVLPCDPKPGAVLTLSNGAETHRQDAFCHRALFPLCPNTDYVLEAVGCELGFVYLSQGESLCTEGIRVLAPEMAPTPFRESTHFTPPCGWLNDPNGLCFHGGWYHLYYQFYPHGQHWGNMHWGHSVSHDLIHWIHQRVFLTPQQALLERRELVGGAFSGSAVAEGEGLRFTLTRHSAPENDELAMEEVQVTLYSPDGMAAGEEETVITKDSAAFSHHFRDPKVLESGGQKQLVLGSCVDGVPAILGYASPDGRDWRYTGPVLTVPVPGCESIECPDLFPLGDTWVAVAALMNLTDGDGRKNPLRWYAGPLCGGTMAVEGEGLFDFGGSFYAVQTFSAQNRRIAIGWVSDFYGEHVCAPGGVCGSMSYPRELLWRGGRLWMRPVEEVYRLLGGVLFHGRNAGATKRSIPGNAYYARISMTGDGDFTAVLAREEGESLRLERRDGAVCLRSDRTPEAVFRAPCAAVRLIEVFFDHRTAEVFLNGGEAAGTKTFYCKQNVGHFSFAADRLDEIAEIELRSMGNEEETTCLM